MIRINHSPIITQDSGLFGTAVMGFFRFYFLSQDNYLLFYTLIGGFSTVMLAGIFIVFWNSH